jgi:mannitol-1-phosphate/altronate dehydrogenase
MRRLRHVHTDERGLMGKLALLWLLVAALLLVLGYDGVRIAVTRFRVAEAAQDAAFEAARTLQESRGDRQAAYDAAVQAVLDAGLEADRLRGFVIDPQTEAVTVTVTSKAPTLLVGRIGFLRPFAKARSTESSPAT